MVVGCGVSFQVVPWHTQTNNPSKEKQYPAARIADYFDIAAGTSVGGILATMLFPAQKNGKPLFRGEQSWRLTAEKGKQIFKIPKRQQAWAKLRGIVTPCYSTKYLLGLLKQYLVRDNVPLTLRDTVKPMLIPCYNLETVSSFLFLRTCALIDEKWNFTSWEICHATSAVPSFFKPAKLRSTNGGNFMCCN
jgi:patatin-like phospholipase/acyl hydrolase